MSEPKVGDKFYRIYAQNYSTIVDAEREEYGSSGPYLEETIFIVEKLTPKGCWINFDGWKLDKSIFVRNDARKKYAYPSRTEALDGYIKKKERHIKILRAKIADAQMSLNMALAVKRGEHVWMSRVKMGEEVCQ